MGFKSIEYYLIKRTSPPNAEERTKRESKEAHNNEEQRVLSEFRLRTKQTKTRHETIYEKLTTLDDQEDIIENFAIIGSNIFFYTTEGKGYFLEQDGNLVAEVTLKIPKSKNENGISKLIIKDYLGQALIITSKFIALCDKAKGCEIMEEYYELSILINAYLFEEDGIHYIFLVDGFALSIYELTANGKIKNRRVISAKSLGWEKHVEISSVAHVGRQKLLVLDRLKGLVEVAYKKRMDLLENNTKILHGQKDCRDMFVKDNNIVLVCAISKYKEFIIRLTKDRKGFDTYHADERFYTNEPIYGITITNEAIIMHSGSGVKMIWISSQANHEYPHEFAHAGNIFLHNAKQAVHFENTLYLSTGEEIWKYYISIVRPHISCYSSSSIEEEYKLKYTHRCQNPEKRNICEANRTLHYSAWAHKEVRFVTMLVPFVLAVVSFLVVIILVYKVYKSMIKDIEEARLRYNEEPEFELN